MLENFEKVEILAANLTISELPILSADEVYQTLEISFQPFYEQYGANNFYTQMIYSYENDPAISPGAISPCSSPGAVSPSTSPLQKTTGKSRKSRKSRRDSGIFEGKSEEFETFRMDLKRHRLRLGLTQADAAKSISKITNRKTSQTSLCRFENNQLHPNNMKNLYPHFRFWIQATSKY